MNLIKVGTIPSAILISILSQQAAGSGFAIIEHSASGMGNAFAGAAAVANDASIGWFNPAGMALLNKPQLVVSGHVVAPTADFTDKGSYVNPALTPDATGAATVTPGSLTGSNDDGGHIGLIPNLYYSRPINDTTWFGISINVPFGLATEYKSDWVGRYHALDSAVSTLNLNPALAWRLNEQLSVGVGISAQYITVDLSNAIDSSAACLKIASTNPLLLGACSAAGLGPGTAGTLANDSKADIEGADDWSFGFNFGLMYEPTAATQVGFSYRSEIEHDPEGDVDFQMNPAFDAVLTGAGIPLFTDTGVSATASLPASASLSVAHAVDSKLQLLGDITWTGWSSFEELRIKFDNPLQPDAFTDESWEDVFRFSVGANYQYNDTITLRAGLAFDEEAIPSAQRRTPRIPGNDRTWLSFGAGYKLNDNINLDFGFAHLFVDETPIDHVDENGYAIRGVYDADVNILSSQLTWNF